MEITTEAVRDVIISILEKGTGKDGKALKKEIDRRKNEIWAKIGKFDRIRYFDTFNSILRERFYKLVDGTATQKDLNVLKASGFGTKQWSDESFNLMDIHSVCPNVCAYCYISGIYNHYGRVQLKEIVESFEKDGIRIVSDECTISGRDRVDRRAPFKIDPEKAATTWGPQGKRKLFMSPTAHDTFPENVDALIAAWKRLLDAGHYIIVVSKPLLLCIDKITSELAGYKGRVLFRFTITSNDQGILDSWELFAPTFGERVECLKMAKDRGFTVSVSMEPFLSDPVETVKAIREHVNGEIWIGMMNGFPSEKVIGKPFSGKLKAEIDRVKGLYSFENVERVVAALRGDPAIQWKESFIKAYAGRRKAARSTRYKRDVKAAPKTLFDYR
jgi:hypothetical protein